MDSSSSPPPPSLADQAPLSAAQMQTPTQSYKDANLASPLAASPHPLPPSSSFLSIPAKVDSAAAAAFQFKDSRSLGPSSSKRPSPFLQSSSSSFTRHHFDNRDHDYLHHLQAPSSGSSPLSCTARCDTATTSLEEYDWTPILLLTPPPSSHSSKLLPSPSEHSRDTSGCFRSPHSEMDLQRSRNAVWQSSPTLSTQRARKLSQHTPSSSLMLDRIALGSAASDSAELGVSFTVSSKVAQSSPGPELSRGSPPLLGTEHSVAEPGASLVMMPPTKPRAHTLDGSGRPILPPLLGHYFNSQLNHLGPIRSSLRHGAEYRSNPYFISTPARKQNDYFALSPFSSRGAREIRAMSLFPGQKTPTSSIRSTSSGVHQDYTSFIRPSNSRTFLGAPLQLEGSSAELRPLYGDPTKKEDGGSPGATMGSRLPSSHLATPDNALGLFVEPNPFPSDVLHLDLGPAAHCGPSPRSEADFFLGQGGSSGTSSSSINLLSGNTRNPSRVLTRSPAILSEASSQLPSPSTLSDDSLTLLPLAHRHDLNRSNNIDPSLDLPALRLHDASPPSVAPASAAKPGAKIKDDSFIYKMPILRAMSPLADMSSDDSEDQDSDEPLIGPSMSTRSSVLNGSTPSVVIEQPDLPLPQEGRTGEIFVTPKAILPITLKQGGSNTTEKLFCKLNSTSHQCFSVVDGKWACYRRNYLKVDVSFHFEDEQGRRRGEVQGDLICEPTGRAPFVVERFAVHMTAHVVNSDGRLQKGRQGLVPLIQFGPARERGPREAVQPVELRSGGTIVKDASANEQAATRSGTIAAFRRVQIRSATMNNGQRGAASQQFYALKLTLLAYPRQGAVTVSGGVEVASLVSHPITVRGRSKVHYAHPSTGTTKKESAAASSVSRRASAGPAANVATTSSGVASKRSTPARSTNSNSSSMSPDQRRSSRRLLAAVRASSQEAAAETMQDADDELEEGELSGSSSAASQRRVCRVMDIRSII